MLNYFSFSELQKSIEKYLERDDWYMWANMKKGTITLPVFQSLDAFWPGLMVCVLYQNSIAGTSI